MSHLGVRVPLESILSCMFSSIIETPEYIKNGILVRIGNTLIGNYRGVSLRNVVTPDEKVGI
jgi:hypothetical protein